MIIKKEMLMEIFEIKPATGIISKDTFIKRVAQLIYNEVSDNYTLDEIKDDLNKQYSKYRNFLAIIRKVGDYDILIENFFNNGYTEVHFSNAYDILDDGRDQLKIYTQNEMIQIISLILSLLWRKEIMSCCAITIAAPKNNKDNKRLKFYIDVIYKILKKYKIECYNITIIDEPEKKQILLNPKKGKPQKPMEIIKDTLMRKMREKEIRYGD